MVDRTDIDRVYKFAVTPFLRERFAEGNYSPQAMLQFEPDIRELEDVASYSVDPTGERGLKIASSLVQVHENRVAFTITLHCQAYCRFCFRKDRVGSSTEKVSEDQIEEGISHIREDLSISDVLISGGDPFAVPMATLERIVDALHDIDHVRAIRVHSRVVTVDPDRISADFLRKAEIRWKKLWFYVHVNHPDDLNHPSSQRALRSLQATGVPILTQSVLLAGVNDEEGVLKNLFEKIYENRLIAYHLYTLDRATGTAHFALSEERIAELYAGLSQLSGPARPRLVVVDANDIKHSTSSERYDEILKFLRSRRPDGR